MARRIVIRFPGDRSYDYYTRVFHFAESLYGPIVNAGLGTLNDIDHARETIWVDVSSKRHLGTVRGIVAKALHKHMLGGDAVTTTE